MFSAQEAGLSCICIQRKICYNKKYGQVIKDKKPQSGTSGTILSAVLFMALGVGLYRALLLCDEMYLELLGENRRGTVDAMLTKPHCRFMRQMKDFPSVLRTEYALALLHDGDKERAALLRGRFEKIAEAYPYRGDIEQERSLLALADGKIQNIG